MKFSEGFLKVAAFGHNNQGLEFREADTNPLPNVGPGGMAPSGIETYQPIEKDQKSEGHLKKKKPKLSDKEVVNVLLHKTSSQGSRAGITGTTVTQLKYESSTPNSHEVTGQSYLRGDADRKKFMRAKKL